MKLSLCLKRTAFSGFMLLVMMQSSCAWLGLDKFGWGNESETEATLADLRPGKMPDGEIELPSAGLDKLAENYRQVMREKLDPQVKVQVMHRLADLELLRGEEELYDEQESSDTFKIAIEAYEEVLTQHPDREDNDRILYQLSKAYDLSARADKALEILTQLAAQYPNSEHYPEAQFRRAENFFAASDYATSEKLYGAVIERGEFGKHYQNALYMHGWSQFKLGRNRASLASFTKTLDISLPEGYIMESVPRGEREIVNDTLRVMSVVFSYLDGAQSITELYQSLGKRHYEPLLYDNLGQLYLKQERYRDSAEVYRAFVKRHPLADEAPEYYGKLIKAFEQGDFIQEILTEKEIYVSNYGVDSDYWQSKYLLQRDKILPLLKQYINELARHYHAQAQTLKASKEKDKRKQQQNLAQAKTYFQKAANYYQSYIDTFPDDETVANMMFLLAEARFEAEQFPQAITAYEKVTYDYPDSKNAADAGYSAILSYDRQLEYLAQNGSDSGDWHRSKIETELRFSDQFGADSRAPAVLTRAAEELLELQEYRQAAIAAKKMVAQYPAGDKKLLHTAWLVIGHAEFELANFVEAELAYQEVLGFNQLKGQKRKDIVERVAASVYKQGEQLLGQGDELAAAQQFLRVALVAPQSSIRVTAQYDAATNLLIAKAWPQAIQVLTDFRVQYPRHKLAAEIPAKLVLAYQEQGEWQKAADELSVIYNAEKDPTAKRQALYLAAELYEKAGDKDTAILRYRSYAHGYPDPFPVAMEARFKLSELYLETDQDSKRRFWLKKMIDADRSAGANRTDRSRYLAAMSSAVFSEDSYQAFLKLKLKLPLKRSLKKKRTALDKALKALQKTADYEVQEYSTMAAYKIGSIYANLSVELMDSERPKNLDELALEQYALLLEEQAFPFEEKAIEIHEANVRYSWEGVYDDWVKQSFTALAKLLPARYVKHERRLEVIDEIY